MVKFICKEEKRKTKNEFDIVKKEKLKTKKQNHEFKFLLEMELFLATLTAKVLQSLFHHFIIIIMVSWCRVVVVITTAKLHSTKPQLTFYTGLKHFCSVTEISDGENL